MEGNGGKESAKRFQLLVVLRRVREFLERGSFKGILYNTTLFIAIFKLRILVAMVAISLRVLTRPVRTMVLKSLGQSGLNY